MDILLYLMYFVLGYYLATIIFTFRLKMTIKRVAEENNINLGEIEEKTKVKLIPVLMTDPISEDNILLYDDENNFVCQGKSLDEVAENLLKYKNIKLAYILHNNTKFWFTEGKVEKL